jgi:hypothetical protein
MLKEQVEFTPPTPGYYRVSESYRFKTWCWRYPILHDGYWAQYIAYFDILFKRFASLICSHVKIKTWTPESCDITSFIWTRNFRLSENPKGIGLIVAKQFLYVHIFIVNAFFCWQIVFQTQVVLHGDEFLGVLVHGSSDLATTDQIGNVMGVRQLGSSTPPTVGETRTISEWVDRRVSLSPEVRKLLINILVSMQVLHVDSF